MTDFTNSKLHFIMIGTEKLTRTNLLFYDSRSLQSPQHDLMSLENVKTTYVKADGTLKTSSPHQTCSLTSFPCCSNLPDAWTSGGGFTRVATALSESSSIHSEALFNLTKDLPTIGLEPMTYSILEAKPYIEELWAEEMQSLLQPVSWLRW